MPRHAVALALGALLVSVSAAGAQTMSKAPKATTADFAWLAGSWEAHPASGIGTIEVNYMPPNAGLISGVMRLVKDGKVLVIELIAMVDTPDGVEMRFRHFSSSLAAYESDFKQNMRLTAYSPEKATFENQVPFDGKLMSTQPRVTDYIKHSKDEFVGRSDIINADGTKGVMESTYLRKRP